MDYPVPFPNAYWVLPGKLLAGPYPGDPFPDAEDERLRRLARSGIRCVIDLTEDGEADYYGFDRYLDKLKQHAGNDGKIVVRRIPIRDRGVPSKLDMKRILDEIDLALAEDCPVYVHCIGGIGRTGTVVGCYLARHGIAGGEGALEKIARLRCENENASISSPESDVQRNMVRSWRKGE